MKKRIFLRFPYFKEKALTLSYDDGVVFDKKLVSILDNYGLKCTFNLNSGLFAEKKGEWRLTRDEAIDLYGKSSHEVAVHGVEHLSLSDVPGDVVLNEIFTDRKNLETYFGKIVEGMAYAYGAFNDDTIETLKACNIKYARTVNDSHCFDLPDDWLRLKPTCHHTDPKLFDLLDDFLNGDNAVLRKQHRVHPRLFFLWGHSYEFDENGNWDLIEKFAAKAGNRDDVWYATNGEIFDYVQAFDRLEFSLDGKIIRNPSAVDLYADVYGQLVEIPSGKTIIL